MIASLANLSWPGHWIFDRVWLCDKSLHIFAWKITFLTYFFCPLDFEVESPTVFENTIEMSYLKRHKTCVGLLSL